MLNNRVLFCFALAAGIVLWCAYSTLIPRQLSFEQRWEPVKFIVPFYRAA